MSRSIEKRRQMIFDLVNQRGSIDFSELKKSFSEVSEVTLRKDLKYLDENGQLTRVHGGVKAVPLSQNFSNRTEFHLKEKELISMKAASLIQPHSSIFITAGTTCAELAKRVPQLPLYICSDGLDAASNLSPNPDCTVEILGGELNLTTMRISGLSVLSSLEGMHFNLAFLGTPGFHPDYGFSYLSPMTSAIISKVVEKSDTVVMLMDSSKVNYALDPRNIPLDSIDILVSDGLLEADVAKKIEDRGVKII